MSSTSVLQRSFPTVRVLTAPFRWVGRRRRRILCPALAALSIVSSPVVWWSAQLFGLPDIGDPFDVAAFRASAIPHDRNGFVLYGEAAALLEPIAPYLKKSKNDA